MSLVFTFANARDLLAKLRRDAERLGSALSSNDEQSIGDALFDFAVTGHSLKDWAKAAAAAHPPAVDVEEFVKNNVALLACRDIANSSKHQSITRYVAATSRVYASANEVLDVSGFNKKTAPDAEPMHASFKIKVLMTDGIKLELQQFAQQVIAAWDSFLSRRGI